VVSTEDEEIGEISKRSGAELVKRPDELATDEAGTVEVVIDCLERLKNENYEPEVIILLQCTSPLRNRKHIDEAIEIFLKSDKADSVMSVSEVEHPPWWNKSIDEEGFVKDFLEYDKQKFKRRQDFPKTFTMNGAIYIIKTDVFVDRKSFETERTLGYHMENKYSIDIDTEIDFVIAETIMREETKQ